MTSLQARIEGLERLMRAGQIDQIDLTCWRKTKSHVPSLRALSQVSKMEAELFLIASNGEKLEEDADPQVAMALFLGALSRTGARGSVSYSPGMNAYTDPDGRFPTEPPASWSSWPLLWTGLQRWIASAASRHGQIEAHRRDAERSGDDS